MNIWLAAVVVGFVVLATVMARATLIARKQLPVGPWRIEPPVSKNLLLAAVLGSIASIVVMAFIDPAFLVIMLAVLLGGWTSYLVRKGLPQIYMWYVLDAAILVLVLAIILRETVFR